jgi:hypothetical protein
MNSWSSSVTEPRVSAMDTIATGEGADPLLERLPVEDAGASTARWYQFQWAIVNRYCLEMARPSSGLAWVLCEWHADYALGWKDGTRTLASVKYREPDSGAWTIARLFSDGGLSKLLKRWDSCGRPKQCQWVTNGGLDLDCRNLRDACLATNKKKLASMASELRARFGQPVSVVAAFLSALRIEHRTPAIEYIRIIDTENYARSVLVELGLTPEAAKDVYDAAMELVRAAAQALGRNQGPWMLALPGALDRESAIRADVKRRMITREQVLAVVRSASVPAAAALPEMSQPVTRLVAKLSKGKVVPNAYASARRARRAWTEYERSITPPLPGNSIGPDFRALRTRLTAEAADAQLGASRTGEPYGNLMLSDMQDRVASVVRDMHPSFGVDPRLLMGLVYDLTAQCEIWWSPEFRIEDAL